MFMPDSSTVQNPAVTDPKSKEAKPEFEQPKTEYPGSPSEMAPRPDHGEESYEGLGRLNGRVALITGGDSGIGRAVAIAFAREGADILINYLPEEESDANETITWVKKAGRKSVKLPAELTHEERCKQIVDRAFEEFGKLDLLINVAGFQATHDKIEEFTTEEFDHTFKTNVYALFWLSRSALPRMKQGSAIVNTASIQAYEPSPQLLPYAATKAAIVSITKTLSQIAMKQGVRVNAVAPGPVWTPLIPSTMPEEKVKKFGQNTAFGRPAQPVEVAPLYVFLASNEARFVTGEIYGVTGGRTPY
jgi:NAD(P)-dependent dehydrogenase (short-subunit alcohol dehydrogenase family)